MATRNIPFPDKVRDMVLDVIKHVRRQEYTPEQLCQLQKIIECKYFYWWCMDMKKEEYVMELFTDDFRYYLNGHLAVKDKLLQARNAKWCNKDMQTMHMGHQPMIWLIDDTHARGVFQYEDHMCYYDDCEVLQSVLRTAKPMGRWMFALLVAVLMLQGATVAAKAAGGGPAGLAGLLRRFCQGQRWCVAHPEAAHGLSRDGRQLPQHHGTQGLGAG